MATYPQSGKNWEWTRQNPAYLIPGADDETLFQVLDAITDKILRLPENTEECIPDSSAHRSSSVILRLSKAEAMQGIDTIKKLFQYYASKDNPVND